MDVSRRGTHSRFRLTAFARYFLKAVQWARKYGIRINLDLHALPGSQNGWNHSGRLGTTNFLNGPMGLANAQRSLDYIRIIAEFISQPAYKNVVPMFSIANEPFGPTFGQDNLSRLCVYHSQSYREIAHIPFSATLRHTGSYARQAESVRVTARTSPSTTVLRA